jgi:hypothetical protein
VVLVVMGYVVATEQDRATTRAHRRAAETAAAQRAAVRLSLLGAGDVAVRRGVPGVPTQDALVRVGLHNGGPESVDLQAATVDGTPRGLTGAVAAGATVDVLLAWQVRCAEVGTLGGPFRLELQARVPAGPVEVTLGLPAYNGRPGLGRTFHLAAVDACDVLVSKETG